MCFHKQSETTWAYTDDSRYDGPNGKMKTYIQQYYGVKSKFTEAWDFVQSEVMCIILFVRVSYYLK